MRSSRLLLGIAVTLAVTMIVATEATSSTGDAVVRPLLGAALMSYVVLLLLGSSRWLAVSAVPVAAAVVVEAGLGDNPSWIRSILLGSLCYVTIEMGWEAIDRRNHATHTAAANLRRVQEVAQVLALSLVVGLVAAAAASSLAPERSVALQALVLGALLVVFVSAIRQVATSSG